MSEEHADPPETPAANAVEEPPRSDTVWPRFSLLELLVYMTVVAVIAKSATRYGAPVLVPTIGIFLASLNCRGKLRFLQETAARSWLLGLVWLLSQAS